MKVKLKLSKTKEKPKLHASKILRGNSTGTGVTQAVFQN